jgi:hypothetical protein
MRLTEGLIAEFQKRYLETFGEHISPETAESELLSLAELVEITRKPIKANKENDNGKQSITQTHG